MNLTETRALLGLVSAAYDRAVPPGKDVIWHDTLSDLPADLAKAGLIEAMKESDWPPAPSMVLRCARQITARQREADKRDTRARAIDARPVASDHTRPLGAQMVGHVLAKLAAAREANGGPLGRERAAILAEVAVEGWREDHPAPPIAPRTGTPCTNPACRCTHTEGCEAGWRSHAGQVRACRECNPRRATILTTGASRDLAQHQLRDTSDLKGASS